MRAYLVLVLIGSSAFAVAGADDKEKAELRKLQGTWLHVSTERNGDKRPEPRTLWVFEGNRAKVHHQTRPIHANGKAWTFEATPTNHMMTYHFKLDPSQNPKTMDQHTEYLDSKKTTTKPRQAIYKLEGDTLTICYIGYYDKGKRPTEFSAAKGSDRHMYVLKREKR